MEFDALSNRVIGCAIEVHRLVGPGLLESTYEQCLAHELNLAGIRFRRQHPLPVSYKGILLDCGYRVDLLIENQLILELKTVEKLSTLYESQLLTYLKHSNLQVGLLINFNVTRLGNGIKRVVNTIAPS